MPEHVVGVDVGGTTIKSALVDAGSGILMGQRFVADTPRPATPAAISECVAEIVRALAPTDATSVGIALPAVVRRGVVETAANIDPSWIGYPVEDSLHTALARPVTAVNDADAAGIAETRRGAAAAGSGVVVVTTLGTGIGSALLVDGTLVPNTELGHLPMSGRPAEHLASTAAREREGLSYVKWAERLTAYYGLLESLLTPDLIVVGGAVSASADRFLPHVRTRAPIVPAALGNDAGVIGAALAGRRVADQPVVMPAAG